jgi:hypothetical protein
MSEARRSRPPLVRSYLATGGRTRASRPLFDVLTVLHAPGDLPVGDLGPDHRRLVHLCVGSLLPLLEAAAAMRLPTGITKVLVADLVDSGHLIARAPIPQAAPTNRELAERLIRGLQAL